MKLKALAPAALILFSGYALAQDASKDKYDAGKAAAPAQTQQQSQSSSKAATPSTAQQGANSQSRSSTTASATATSNVTFAAADSNKDGKLSIAEMKVVMPDVTIIDTDSDGYVNQKEAEASITGLSFASGADTALISEQSFSTIVAARDDDDLDVDLDDDADIDTSVEGDVDVEDQDN